MSIFPEQFNKAAVVRRRDIASLDLPIPVALTDATERYQWSFYAECLPFSKKLEKFGQAVDMLIAMPDSHSPAYSQRLDVAYGIHNAFTTVFQTETPNMTREMFDSDFSATMYWIADFLKNVNSPDAAIWEKRRQDWDVVLSNENPKPPGPSTP